MEDWLCYAFYQLCSSFVVHSIIPHITAFVIEIASLLHCFLHSFYYTHRLWKEEGKS